MKVITNSIEMGTIFSCSDIALCGNNISSSYCNTATLLVVICSVVGGKKVEQNLAMNIKEPSKLRRVSHVAPHFYIFEVLLYIPCATFYFPGHVNRFY